MIRESISKLRAAVIAAFGPTPVSRERALELAREECRRLSLPGADDAVVQSGLFSRYYTVVVAASEVDGGTFILVDKHDGRIVGVSGCDDVSLPDGP